MADDLRPEQAAKLTTTPPLPAELVDQVLDASDAERAAAAAELADRTREWLEQIGALRPSASVLDLDCRRLLALAGVFETVQRWWTFPPYRGHPLSTMLKIIPAEHAKWVEFLLVWGGFVPPPGPVESPGGTGRGGRQRPPGALVVLGPSGSEGGEGQPRRPPQIRLRPAHPLEAPQRPGVLPTRPGLRVAPRAPTPSSHRSTHPLPATTPKTATVGLAGYGNRRPGGYGCGLGRRLRCAVSR